MVAFVFLIKHDNISISIKRDTSKLCNELQMLIDKLQTINQMSTFFKMDLCILVSENGWSQLATNKCTNKQITAIFERRKKCSRQ